MPYAYDNQNIFARILRGELPNDTVMESQHSLAFRDLYPQSPDHVLVIPKGPYVCYDHFANEASDAEILDYTRLIGAVIKHIGAEMSESDGYRLIVNSGANAIQDVPHLHVHILAGRPLGRMLRDDL